MKIITGQRERIIPTYLELARQTPIPKSRQLEIWTNPYANAIIGSPAESRFDEIADSFNAALDGGGYYEEFVSDGGDGDEIYLSSSISQYHALASEMEFFIFTRFSLPTITDIRFFVGVCPYSEQGSVNDSDNPSEPVGLINMAGFQFSTGRGDTNFQFCRTNVDESTITLTDTGVAPNASTIYQMELEFTNGGASLRGRLSDHTGTVLYADTTVTDDLPLTPGIIQPFIGLKELAAAVKKFRFYRTEVWA